MVCRRCLSLAVCLLLALSADAFALPQPSKPVVAAGRLARAADFLGGSATPPLVAARSAPAVMIEKPISVGVVGVTGAVGKEIISVLGERGIPMSKIRLFASARSAGKEMETSLGPTMIEEFSLEAAQECDVVFLAVSGDFALEWAEKISADGTLVIDNSSAFRYDPEVALVVPEINAEAAKKSKKKVVANPNCTTAIALMALAPLHAEFGVKRCIMSTYQAASGAGAPGMQELEDGAKAMMTGGTAENKVFAHPLPFNVIPHIDKFLDDGYTKEERKVTWETRKIMDLPDLPVSCTCVRIPTLRAHAEAITIETEKPIDIAKAMEAIKAAPGVSLTDDPAKNLYPMPLTASTKYDVECGRMRKNDVFGEYGLDFFVCGDQLLRGAALNAVLIAEAIM